MSSSASSSAYNTTDDATDDQVDSAIANAPQETFKRWVKEYRTLDKEIKAAGSAISAMRKRKKELDEVILVWMQNNDVVRVHLRDDDYLTRNVKTYQKPVNANLIQSVLNEHFQGDEEMVERLTATIYGSREESEREILKVTTEKSNGAKRPRLRPVDGSGSIE